MTTPPVDDRAAVLAAFAKSIFAKAEVLSRSTLPATYRARVREAVSDDLKKVSNLAIPEVSRAALLEARRLGINLFEKTWHDQPSFDEGREVFHLEHVRPVSALREECLLAASVAEVLEVLATKIRVAWILKSEDVGLTSRGYRSNRPDPDQAYRAAEIELVTEHAARDAKEGE